MASASPVPLLPKRSSIVLSDGAGTPDTFTLAGFVGLLKITGEVHAGDDMPAEIVDGRDGSLLAVVVEKKVIAIDFEIDMMFKGFTVTGADLLLDWIRKTGQCSAHTTTLPVAKGDVHCLQLAYTSDMSPFGASVDPSMTAKYVHFSTDGIEEGLPSKMKLKGRAYIFADDATSVVYA